MRNDDIKIVIDSFREEQKAHFMLLRATVKSEIDRVDEKIDNIIKHQQWQNGKLEKHDCAIDGYDRIFKPLCKRWVWAFAGILFICIFFVLMALYNGTKLGDVLEKFI